ncbi:MAG TPA: autotransporter-associated beta strand repeat-containing protein, partial [Verrucomicrobiales bacterium]|nr:autotransporter-associated beta strand repeat-containing protein [Verrucomicrobiales bacterium]
KLAFSTGTTSFSQDLAYTGPTFIGAGSVVLPMNGTLATSLIDIRGGGLTLNNADDNGVAGGYIVQRIPAATPINLAGTLTVTGNANTPGVHQFGKLSLVGNGTIVPTPGANAPVTMTFQDISRNADHGTLVIGGTNLGLAQSPNGGSRVFATTIGGAAPAAALVGGGGADGTTTMSIVPWAWSSTAGGFVTYGANGFRPLSTVAGVESESALDAPSGPNANIRTTAAVALTAPREVNSLVQATTAGVSGAFDLTLRSGALATTAAGTIGVNSNSLLTGAGGANTTELVVFNSAATTLAYNIATSGGLTKYGAGTLTLTGTNTFTGDLSVQNGLVAFSNDNQLGAPGGAIRFGAAFGNNLGGLQYAGAAGAPIVTNRPLITNSELTFTQTVANQIWSLTGGISGPGSVHYNFGSTNGSIAEPGINAYTGGTQINEGIVAIRGDGINADSAFGNGGQLDIFATSPGGVLQLANWATSRPISISAGSVLNTNGFSATWNGSVQGGSALAKTGAGMLTLTNPNPYTGTMVINGGEVRLRDRGAVNAGFTMGFGTQLILDDTGTHFADRIPDASAITNGNGDLRLLGSSTALTEEVIGNLTLNTAAKVSVVPGAGQAAVLRLGSTGVLARGSASSILFRGTNLGVNAPGTPGSANIMVFNPLNSAAALSGGGGAAGTSAISIIAG